ncbi:MAG: hypothetical protein IKF52_06600 [Clostridia bacterium]|nr:hypothetical protein [Clostridia bacterium]
MKNEQKLKNILVLRNLPSNLIDEAIIILKDYDFKDNENTRRKEHIVDEANFIVSEYLNHINNVKEDGKGLENKCKRLKAFNFVLIFGLFVCAFLGLLGR